MATHDPEITFSTKSKADYHAFLAERHLMLGGEPWVRGFPSTINFMPPSRGGAKMFLQSRVVDCMVAILTNNYSKVVHMTNPPMRNAELKLIRAGCMNPYYTENTLQQ